VLMTPPLPPSPQAASSMLMASSDACAARVPFVPMFALSPCQNADVIPTSPVTRLKS
jgi:hypothetical protein